MGHPSNRLRLSVACLVVAPWLVLAVGCGDDQETGAPATSSTSNAAAAAGPTAQDVEKYLHSTWDKSGQNGPKEVVVLNEVKFGQPYSATVQEVQVEGIPQGGTVTPAIVDFTVKTYYASEARSLRRVREARIYRDKMGDWTVMTGSPKGEDVSSSGPPDK